MCKGDTDNSIRGGFEPPDVGAETKLSSSGRAASAPNCPLPSLVGLAAHLTPLPTDSQNFSTWPSRLPFCGECLASLVRRSDPRRCTRLCVCEDFTPKGKQEWHPSEGMPGSLCLQASSISDLEIRGSSRDVALPWSSVS